MAKSNKPTAQDMLREAIAEAERTGVTRSQMAKAAGMSRSQLSRIANGEIMPKLDTAERVLSVIGREILIKGVARMVQRG